MPAYRHPLFPGTVENNLLFADPYCFCVTVVPVLHKVNAGCQSAHVYIALLS